MTRLITCLFFVFFLSGCATYNPATGRQEMIMFTTDAEILLGTIIHAEIIATHPITQEGQKARRLIRIGRRIAQVSDRQDYIHEFYLIKSDQVNAFTTPGGRVYFFEGLLDKLQADDEVAAVLAHEIAHGAARHTIKKFQAGLGYNLIGGILINQVEDDAKKRIAAYGANFVASLAMSAYSREDEYEADRLGLKYMYLAGYGMQGAVRVFEVLDQNDGKKGASLFRSHPYPKERITAVENQIPVILEKY